MLGKISNREFAVVGSALLVVGVILLIFVWPHFDALPNFERLAVLVPACWGGALTCAETYRNWPTSDYFARMFASSCALGSVGLPIGSLLWWLGDPTAMG